MHLLAVFFSCQLAVATQSSNYKETASNTIKYDPTGSNDFVGAKGTTVLKDGLVLRRSHDEGGLVVFLQDNTYPEWSFEYTITGLDLHFPEQAGVYLWYTENDQDMGNYKGGKGEFVGLMAGIEFKGMSPELVYSFNNGKDYGDAVDDTVSWDSFNPARLKGVKDLTVKVIVTKNNFKIELYDGSRLLYDSLRMVRTHPYHLLGINKRFSITTSYVNTPSEKAFKLINAQLYNRVEDADYDADKVHAEHVDALPKFAKDVAHPDKEIRHFIAQFTHFVEYVKGVLGQPEHPTVPMFGNKILQEIETIKKVLPSRKDLDNRLVIDKVNEIDTRVLNIQKSVADLSHELKEYGLHIADKSRWTPSFFVIVGLSCVAFFIAREVLARRTDKKV